MMWKIKHVVLLMMELAGLIQAGDVTIEDYRNPPKYRWVSRGRSLL